MGKIVLNSDLRAKLNGLTEQMAVHDEDDNLVGVFLPAKHYQALLASLKSPVSDEELDRRSREGGGTSLQEFWKKMGRR